MTPLLLTSAHVRKRGMGPRTLSSAAAAPGNAAGDGSVHKRKQGGWQGSIDVAIVDGRRRRKTVYGATQRAVRDKLAAIRRTLGCPSARGRR